MNNNYLMSQKILLRTEFAHLPSKINWFPGHMRKAMRTLEPELKKVKMFIEVRDARIPRTSANKELLELLPLGMKRIVVYNKMDLVNEKKSMELIKL
jgi:ribosome biogenesis GTPase A